AAFADRDHAAFLRLVLGALGQEDAARGALFRFGALDEHAVAEGTDVAGALVRAGGGLRGHVGTLLLDGRLSWSGEGGNRSSRRRGWHAALLGGVPGDC